jgi:hypothetical protein
LETTAKLLKTLGGILAVFSKCALKSLYNQADFDSAVRRFDPSRASQASPKFPASQMGGPVTVQFGAIKVRFPQVPRGPA